MQSRQAVIARRADPDDADAGAPDPTEMRRLAEAASYEVVGEVTQTRSEDPATQLGRGKAEELAETVADTGASVVAVDNDLTPTQTVELAALCPDGTAVYDRRRLVLDIFEDRAGSERAKLQVQRARLAADLPRIREEVTRELAGEDLAHDEKGGGRVEDVKRRIDELDRKLAELGDEAAQRRERRREEGFAFVALAGYTNAGKSTLLHRLADDLDFEGREADHADLDATAEIEDRLFETLDTTTRRATVDGHRTLVTDTVGFVADLPHDLVASFHGTLSETATADCVAVVADASDPPADLRRKLETSLDVVTDEARGEVVTVLNKVDLLDADELAARERVVAEVVTDVEESLPEDADVGTALASDPVAVSATEGEGIDALRKRVSAALPDFSEAELTLPNGDEAMSLVSWLYDRADVRDVDYGDDAVRVVVAGPESVVERAKSRADGLAGEVPMAE